MDSGKKFRDLLVGIPEEGVKGALENLGMSVEQFAAACGLTRTSVYYYLSGKCIPKSQTIHRMAKVIGITPEKLFEAVPHREEGRPKTKLIPL